MWLCIAVIATMPLVSASTSMSFDCSCVLIRRFFDCRRRLDQNLQQHTLAATHCGCSATIFSAARARDALLQECVGCHVSVAAVVHVYVPLQHASRAHHNAIFHRPAAAAELPLRAGARTHIHTHINTQTHTYTHTHRNIGLHHFVKSLEITAVRINLTCSISHTPCSITHTPALSRTLRARNTAAAPPPPPSHPALACQHHSSNASSPPCACSSRRTPA